MEHRSQGQSLWQVARENMLPARLTGLLRTGTDADHSFTIPRRPSPVDRSVQSSGLTNLSPSSTWRPLEYTALESTGRDVSTMFNVADNVLQLKPLARNDTAPYNGLNGKNSVGPLRTIRGLRPLTVTVDTTSLYSKVHAANLDISTSSLQPPTLFDSPPKRRSPKNAAGNVVAPLSKSPQISCWSPDPSSGGSPDDANVAFFELNGSRHDELGNCTALASVGEDPSAIDNNGVIPTFSPRELVDDLLHLDLNKSVEIHDIIEREEPLSPWMSQPNILTHLPSPSIQSPSAACSSPRLLLPSSPQNKLFETQDDSPRKRRARHVNSNSPKAVPKYSEKAIERCFSLYLSVGAQLCITRWKRTTRLHKENRIEHVLKQHINGNICDVFSSWKRFFFHSRRCSCCNTLLRVGEKTAQTNLRFSIRQMKSVVRQHRNKTSLISKATTFSDAVTRFIRKQQSAVKKTVWSVLASALKEVVVQRQSPSAPVPFKISKVPDATAAKEVCARRLFKILYSLVYRREYAFLKSLRRTSAQRRRSVSLPAKEDTTVKAQANVEQVVLPRLPDMAKKDWKSLLQGPSPNMSWVIREHMLSGPHPLSFTDSETRRVFLEAILKTGINCFVFLQPWEDGPLAVSYEEDIRSLLHSRDDLPVPFQNLSFIKTPLDFVRKNEDAELMKTIKLIVSRMVSKEKLYVHCTDGRKSNVLFACLLGVMYQIKTEEAVFRTHVSHTLRSSGDSLFLRDEQAMAVVFRILSKFGVSGSDSSPSSPLFAGPSQAAMVNGHFLQFRRPLSVGSPPGRHPSAPHTSRPFHSPVAPRSPPQPRFVNGVPISPVMVPRSLARGQGDFNRYAAAPLPISIMSPTSQEHIIFSKCRHGRMEEVEELLDLGVPVDVRDANGNTLLIIASQNGHKKIAQMCLLKGADVNAVNHRGNTALHFAASFGYDAMTVLLLSAKAKPDMKNKDGRVATDYMHSTVKPDILQSSSSQQTL